MSDAQAYRREPAGTQPPYLHPAYASTVQARAVAAAGAPAAHAVGGDRAGLRPRAGRARRRRPHPAARRRAAGRAHHRRRPGAGRGRPAGAGHADRALAVQRRRPLPPRARPARRAARPEFHAAPAARVTDDEGRYRFVTIKPGAYPWRNHPNAWRPAHIHFSLFGPSFLTRLVTQMYFPGDPLLPLDPIFNSRAATRRRAQRLICRLRPGHDRAGMGARLPLRHRAARPRRDADGGVEPHGARSPPPSQTVGPFFHVGLDLARPARISSAASAAGERIAHRGPGARRRRRAGAPTR